VSTHWFLETGGVNPSSREGYSQTGDWMAPKKQSSLPTSGKKSTLIGRGREEPDNETEEDER
jgi:hypothetical protein